MGIIYGQGTTIVVIKGDTRSLGYGSNQHPAVAGHLARADNTM